MFENMDFGGLGNDQLKFISDFYGDEKNAVLKSELTAEQISLMAQCYAYMDMLKVYYGDDFKPFKTLKEIIQQVILLSVSKNRMSRIEFQNVCKGVLDSVDYQSVVDKMAQKNK